MSPSEEEARLMGSTVTDDIGNKNNLLTGPYEYKEPNKELENSLRPVPRTQPSNTSNSKMVLKSEPEEPIGGGDGSISPVNENIPVILQDQLKAAEKTIREEYDASPTPSKIGKNPLHAFVRIKYARICSEYLAS